jgi:hypothetical protein
VADAVGSLRVINVSSTVFAGDSLRLIGSVAVAVGQPVLSVSGVTVLGPGHLPAAVDRSTGSAASAAGGQLDAALVRVSGATISDTASIGTAYFRLTVNDGSGALHVLLDVNAGERNYTADVPGELLDVTGLLVPETAGGTWILKPRKPADIVRH